MSGATSNANFGNSKAPMALSDRAKCWSALQTWLTEPNFCGLRRRRRRRLRRLRSADAGDAGEAGAAEDGARHGHRRCRRHCGLSRHDNARRQRNLFHLNDVGHEVSGLAEAGGRQPDLLFVVQRDALAHHFVDAVGHRIVAHREQELFRESRRASTPSPFRLPRSCTAIPCGSASAPSLRALRSSSSS